MRFVGRLILTWIILSYFLVQFFPMHQAMAFSGSGSGTSGSPYQITSCSQLHEIESDLDANYLVMNDVNCTGFSFTPIGDTTSNFFIGTLDGGGHKISNLTIDSNENGVGIFQTLGSGGLITNLGYESGTITSQGDVVSMGSFAANSSGGTITKSYSKATFDGTNVNFISPTIGGLVGKGDPITISDSYYSGTIVGGNSNPNYTAGLAGYLSAASITNSYSTGTITNGQNVGGITGRMFSSSTISNSFTTMTFTNSSIVGAMVGTITSGTVSSGYWNDTSGGFFTCYFGGNTGCNRITNNIPYFYTITNSPMSSWNFVNTWSVQNNGSGYPLLNWQAPNPTPTPSPSSTPLSFSAPSSAVSAPTCNDQPASEIPTIASITSTKSTASLKFSQAKGTGYNINYGLSPAANQFGDLFNLFGAETNLSRTISYLAPGTTYYFRIRATNGCNAGEWSKTIQARTKR